MTSDIDKHMYKPFDPDDPALTAYVLGELVEEERVAFEARLKSSPEAQQWVEDFLAISGDLGRELKSESCPDLSDTQRQAIDAAAQSSGSGTVVKPRMLLRPAFVVGSVVGLAACALVAVSLVLHHRAAQEPRPEEGQRLVRLDKRASSTSRKVDQDIRRTARPSVSSSASKESLREPRFSAGVSEKDASELARNLVVETDAESVPYFSREAKGSLSHQTDEAPILQYRFDSPEDFAAEMPSEPPSYVPLAREQVTGAAPESPGRVGESRGKVQLPQPNVRARLGGPSSGDDRSFFSDAVGLEVTGNEDYEAITENPFVDVTDDPLSTFSIDVDTASYANVRRFLNQDTWPPTHAVRIEEMVNYFSYPDELPTGEHPFSVNTEIAECPWNSSNRLLRVGLRGKEVGLDSRPMSNLVFLIDVSGSMQPAAKLPLLKRSLKELVEKLGENDRVAIVVYAGASGLALPSTTGDHKETIFAALESLRAGGSTHGSSGIRLAYDVAIENFIQGGVNRVLLASDGDFNVGVTNRNDLVELIKAKAKSGVFLSVLGFGTGNLKDATMEQLAGNGNGNYSYIDCKAEGHKVLVEEMGATLVTVAKDVKIQIEFNPTVVAAHRLVGYENRKLQHHEFNDDTRDAGEIGAGHSIVALYEIVPAGSPTVALADEKRRVDPLRYQREKPAAELTEPARSGELLIVKLRYKEPDGVESKSLEVPVFDRGLKYGQASEDFKFAASVAAFGMILRNSEHRGNASLNAVLELAGEGKGEDKSGRRGAFLQLVERAKAVSEAR